jgi:Secretory lipase
MLTEAASGLQAGYAQLDGFRAVKQSGAFTGVGSDPTITMYGYSGGGVSVAWVCVCGTKNKVVDIDDSLDF